MPASVSGDAVQAFGVWLQVAGPEGGGAGTALLPQAEDGEPLMSRLVTLAVTAGEQPTLEQTDAMLAELRQLPRDEVVSSLIDDLLDYRALLASAA